MVWHRQGSKFQRLFKTTTKIQDCMNHGSIKQGYFQTPHKGCNQVKALNRLSINSRKYPTFPIDFFRGWG